MERVITINLNGNAYQIEESGYHALIGYLEGAQRQLKDNPDRAEILADLEQAIAEKCLRYLAAQKTVVSAAEVDQIIKEMGPVDPADETAGAGGQARSDAGAPRRLYKIHEGAMIAGVCNGIAAYLHVDVTIVRIIFVGLAVITKGGVALAYLVLAFVVPQATTSEERAAAHGEPFNAQELIDRAKKQYADFKDSRDWRRRWRREQRQWKRQWRQRTRGYAWHVAPVPPPAGYAARVVSGFMVPILSLASAALFWLWAYAILSVLTRQEVFGVGVPDDMPFWVGILILVFLYHAIAWPLHVARRASYSMLGGPHHAMVAAFDGLMSIGFAILVVWLAYHYVPEVREFIQTLPDVWDTLDLRI